MAESNLQSKNGHTPQGQVAKYQKNEADLAALKAVLGENLKEDEPIARHTSWRIGGPADYFLRATDEAEVVVLLKTCRSRNIPFLIIGNGSNMLVADKGWRGMVVENRLDAFTINDLGDGRCLLKAGSGALLGALSRRIAKLGWAGFEFAATIPGSVGGGIVSNAGAHGGDFSKVLRRVAVANAHGELDILPAEKLELSYRDSRWREQVGNNKVPLGNPGNELILWAEFELQQGDPVAIKQHIDEMTDWRRKHQPQEPSGGSVFKNPPAPFGSAGSLIEKAGLKGHIIGGAQISPRHANFIINRGEGKAQDVIDLINLARKTVKEQFDADIEPEVEMLGEFD
jgi:UDP-N-acetylmuramate dehydrogenase